MLETARLEIYSKEIDEIMRVVSINYDERYVRALSFEDFHNTEVKLSFDEIEILYPIYQKDCEGEPIHHGDLLKLTGKDEDEFLVEVNVTDEGIKLNERKNPFRFMQLFGENPNPSILKMFRYSGNIFG